MGVDVLHPHAVDAVGPEQAALGVHEPPLPLALFHAEAARGRQLRPGLPAAVLIPVARPGVAGQVLGFGFLSRGEVGGRVDLAGPVLMDVLAEGVDQGKQFGGVGRRRLVIRAAGPDVGDQKAVIGLGTRDEDQELIDVGRVDAALLAPSAREPAHAKQFPPQSLGHFPGHHHAQGLLLGGLQADVARQAAGDAVGPRVVHAQGDLDRLAADILHVDRHALKGREVPAATGGVERDPRPLVLVSRGDLQGPAANGHLGIPGLDLGDGELGINAEQQLLGSRFHAEGQQGEKQRQRDPGLVLAKHGFPQGMCFRTHRADGSEFPAATRP